MSVGTRPIGCIADDITGATDLASALASRGLATRLTFGSAAISGEDCDAVVVALKIRSVPASDARSATIEAVDALRAAGLNRFYFKYCSTFDSTADGNIGPIADVLADIAGAKRVVHCPSYPANGRTVYLGHMFVGDELLSESPMRHHPLNPMLDSQLQRVLAAQTMREVELLRLPTVAAGPDAVKNRLTEIASKGTSVPHVIADAIWDSDIETIAEAVAGDPLAAGAAVFGAAFALAAQRRAGYTPSLRQGRAALPPGPAAILAGSISQATREQVRAFDGATLTIGVGDLVDGDEALHSAVAFIGRSLADGAMLIATDQDADEESLRATGLNSGEVSRRIELAMGRIAIELQQLGVRRLIVAGGETSGAVAEALSLQSARIGPDISTGVPWMVAEDRPLAVAFKSGNFGKPSFFRDALEVAGS